MKGKPINFEQFKKEWCNAMVYRPKDYDSFTQFMQDQYVIYKEDELDFRFIDIYTVNEFCEFFYPDADLDTHPYMIKSKAFNSKHVKGLINLIKRNYKSMKEVIIKFKFNDEGGYKGHGDDVAEIIYSILKREIEIELEGDRVVKEGWKLEVVNNGI